MPPATGGSSNPDISSSRKLTFKHNDGRLILLPPSASSTTIQQIKFPESAGTADQSLKIKTDGISTDPNESNRKIVLTEWGAGGGGGGGGGNASTITLANETGNDERFIVFSNTSAPNIGTSSVSLKTNSTLKFNSSTNVLSTTTFNGNLTGTATTATNLSSTLTIAQGGTNATDVSSARTALGVDAAGTDNSTDLMLSSVAANYLSLDEDNQILTAGVVPITLGGTGATSASTARTTLGVDAAGTDNSTDLMLSSVADNYLTLDEDNQILTAGVVPITLGGTGATSASTARTALGVDAAGTDNSTNVILSSVAGNYLSLDEDNQILTAGVVPKTLGGTNATSASDARTNLEIQENVGFVNGDKTKLDSIEAGANVTTSARVSAAGAFMTDNSINTLTGNLVIGENDNDLMVVNSDMITNGYIRSSSRFSPVTNLNPTPLEFTIDSSSLDNIKHLDSDSSGNIDTSVYLNDIRDIDRVLVMGKIHIGFSGPNIFASVLLIKRLYDSSGNLITSAGNSGNIEVGSGTDSQDNTRDAFLDGSNGLTMTRIKIFQVAILRNLGGHFLDTNPTEGVSGVSKISYHYAIIPLHPTPLDDSTDSVDGIRIATPVNTSDTNRCSAATILSLVPFSCNL
jgi:hypothetical protein